MTDFLHWLFEHPLPPLVFVGFFASVIATLAFGWIGGGAGLSMGPVLGGIYTAHLMLSQAAARGITPTWSRVEWAVVLHSILNVTVVWTLGVPPALVIGLAIRFLKNRYFTIQKRSI
jgi:hypothetical protein